MALSKSLTISTNLVKSIRFPVSGVKRCLSDAVGAASLRSDELLRQVPTTSKLDIADPQTLSTVPAYRVLSPDGNLVAGSRLHPSLTTEKIIDLYSGMVRLNTLDRVMFDSHRQGRISFYMTSFGEEAATVGSAAALEPQDWIYAQYREAGVLVHRKMPLKQMLAQCYGNSEDLGKGRQMPIHYGNRELNFVTISSPLTTQLPQAVGSAYTFKSDNDSNSRIVMCYFGEGAASEGDAHAAMNMAATLSCPIIFFCRNNRYAISTPSSEQYSSDGIVNRAVGYGMSSIRVDGNDLFAVFEATHKARDICIQESRPILVEAMTYRVGHHSTSDDSLAYRSSEEVKRWEQEDSPIKRLKMYLLNLGAWSEDRQRDLEKETRREVIEALNWAERKKKAPIASMFEDVYDKLPRNLERQCEELRQHLDKYGQHYPVDEYDGFK